MPQFGEKSIKRLAECHHDLQTLFNEVIMDYDCSILVGARGKEEQERTFAEGRSKKHWPDSPHNKFPSRAVDVSPYPVDFSEDRDALVRWYHFAGYVLGVASRLGIRIRWGGDWNSNDVFTDQNFNDLPHFEIIE